MDYRAQFLNVLKARGVPVSEQEQKALWEQSLVGQGLAVKNQSPQSPFWRAQKAIVGEATSKLTNTLVDVIMPNSFILLAEDEWLDQHGRSRNVPRLPELKAQGNLVLSRTDTQGALTIPKGTQVQSDPVDGRVYVLELLNDIQFEDGQGERIALAEALESGSAYNLVAGYYTQLVTPIEGVSVINLDDWLVRPGQDIESNANYRLRCRDKFATLGNYHVDAVYRSMIAEFPGMLAENIVFEHNAPRGPGTANAYVFLEIGTVSQALLDEINNHISAGNHGNGDDLVVMALPEQPQDIHVKYWQHPNTDSIKLKLVRAIRAAFRENAMFTVTKAMPNQQFSFSLLASELHALFPELKSIQFINDDIQCGMWLPKINSLVLEQQ
ncbi:hypothetical protein CWC05_03530 [Pseudoalteromonas ruthenica]|uniref:Baseplate protein J-like barrel domain-containing protein n=1 Tax=Pseudoalteromonas ruthenica TaxID=151081 RepID=A0A5S3Z8J0_9GAMM|nr:baseplate J/gp47 family protein [Pseudoalteromonas ruthenica]TMP88513.1 hypothetical protein CWC05_03530 [Pseudoalteromonas ruthenica]